MTPFLEQERPCTRCIKRNIGHLCHDEPRDHDNKKVGRGSTVAGSTMDESESQQSQSDLARGAFDQASGLAAAAAAMRPPSFDGGATVSAAGGGAIAGGGITTGPAGTMGRGSSLQQLVRPTQAPGSQTSGLRNSNMNQCKCSSSRKFSQTFHPSLPRPPIYGFSEAKPYLSRPSSSRWVLRCLVDCTEPSSGYAQLPE